MKTCTYCAAENRDDATVCYACGSDLGTLPFWPAADTGADPTQPVRVRSYPPQPAVPGPFDTQQFPLPSTPPPAGPQATSPYPPAYSPPPPYIPPPPPPPAYNRGPSRAWPALLVGLFVVLLVVCGLAVWTLTSATTTEAARLRAQISTQAAGIFPGGGGSASEGIPPVVETALPAEPTPWPTFTPPAEPTALPPAAPTALPNNPTPDATQAVVVEKLLSPGCKSSLDSLGKLSDQITSQPTVAFDSTWRASLDQAVADMKTNCGTLDAASPVPGLVNQAHQDLARSQSEFDQAGKLFNEGVSNLDPGKLLEAGQHVQDAAKYLNLAITEIKKIGQ